MEAQEISSLLGKFLESKPVFPILSDLVNLLPEVTGAKDKETPKQVAFPSLSLSLSAISSVSLVSSSILHIYVEKQSSEFGTLTQETLPSYFVVLFTHLTKHLQTIDLGM